MCRRTRRSYLQPIEGWFPNLFSAIVNRELYHRCAVNGDPFSNLDDLNRILVYARFVETRYRRMFAYTGK